MFTVSTSILYLADKYIKNSKDRIMIYLSARYNILVLIVNIVGIPTCSQHLLT
jgi:septum formation topological specificity factor MinE